MTRATRNSRRPGGFTLIELGVVMAIIGIIISLVLVAGAEGVRRAEERATQGLISKLDQGVTERLDALMSTNLTPNGAHRYLAAVYAPYLPVPLPWGLLNLEDLGRESDRAKVIARLDYIKAEMPDVFLIESDFLPGGTFNADGYPFNFAALPYPGPAVQTIQDRFMLPLGHMAEAYRPNSYADPANQTGPYWRGPGDNEAIVNGTIPAGNTAQYQFWKRRSTGIYGASYSARGALNKLLGCAPTGYDMVDNDNDGYTDEWNECVSGLSPPQVQELQDRLAKHTHKTARAEALYALLIEGIGPLGSVFSRDEFTDLQVKDTDGDGLPEFVDSWGEPIQFYRWPVQYVSDVQKGTNLYFSAVEPREQSPLDPNNVLVTPAWWSLQFNGGGNTAAQYPQPSPGALTVMNHFTPLIEPTWTSGTTTGVYWDRSGASPRRAYFSRPLVLSSGPDRQLGVAQLRFDYTSYSFPSGSTTNPNMAVAPLTASGLILFENPASTISPYRDTSSPPFYPVDPSIPGAVEVQAGLNHPNDGWGIDDISNQTLQRSGGGLQ